MDEKVFFDEANVRVTNARFVNDGQTYAMSNVTSVKAFEDEPKRVWAIVLLVLGVMFAITVPYFGVPVALVALFILWRQKTSYHVMLATSGGEVSALSSDDRGYVERVVSAINQAIIARG